MDDDPSSLVTCENLVSSLVASAISLALRKRRDRCWLSFARGATPSMAIKTDTFGLTICVMILSKSDEEEERTCDDCYGVM